MVYEKEKKEIMKIYMKLSFGMLATILGVILLATLLG